MTKITDYISGLEIASKPEEIDAVQPFSKQLVEDYNYPKDQIQTRPQFRVKANPSDTKKSFPVDIVVFSSKEKNEKEAYIIVECKKKNRKDGRSQLENYLTFSNAYLGVWFNGKERIFIQKYFEDDKLKFREIPNIPLFGQRVEDIGKFKRKDLKPTNNLIPTFKSIRNFLAANTVGVTRDEVFAQQLINVIFCKIYDERFTPLESEVRFRCGVNEDPEDVSKRIKNIFEDVKRKYREVFNQSDNIELDPKSLVYIVGEMQIYSLIDAERDVVGDAFETFIGSALKGAQGQFFTPRNLVKMMIEILDPSIDDLIIDPACGSGGFITETLRYIWKKLDADAEKYGWNEANLNEEKLEVAIERIRGIDKDYFLSKVSKAYMAILGDGKGGIFTDNSLEDPSNWDSKTKAKVNLGTYSILLANPPFGSKIKIDGKDLLSQYELGHEWKKDKITNKYQKGKIKNKETPQIIFIERCIQLLQEEGKMGIVLPDGVFGNDHFEYVREFLIKNGKILAVIDVPIETFQPKTSTKTSILFFQKLRPEKIPDDYNIFMASLETCGHDRRGNIIDSDDISQVSAKYKEWLENAG